MPAYLIIDSTVHDTALMKGYVDKVGATLTPFGGKRLISTDQIDVIEGDWAPQRIVVLEFPDADACRRWYVSPEYQEILPIRFEAADDNLLLVEGP